MKLHPIKVSNSLFRVFISFAVAIYAFFFIGVYREPGSVNEWLHISQIGLTGGTHWGILSHTYSLPTLARALGVSTPEGWRAMVESIALFSICALFITSNRMARDPRTFALMSVFLVYSPLVRSVFNGQADYDGLTILGVVLILSALLTEDNSSSSFLAALGGIVFGLTNPQQSAAALLSLWILKFIFDRSGFRVAVFSSVGLIASSVIVRFFLRDEGIIGRDRGIILGGWRGLLNYQRMIDYTPHLFGGAWVIVISLLVSIGLRRGFKSSFTTFLFVVLLPLIALGIHTDGMRIFSMVTVLPCLFLISRSPDFMTPRTIVLVLIATTIVQTGYLLTGQLNFEPEFPTMYENLSSRPNPLP